MLPLLAFSSDKVDSLQHLLRHTKADTFKVQLLSSIGFEYWSASLDSLLKYESQSLQLAEKISFEKGKVGGLHGLGVYYWQKGNYDTAYRFYEKALLLAQKYNEIKSIGDCYGSIGSLLREKGEHSKAQDYYNKALQEYDKINFVSGKARIMNSTAIMYRTMQNYPDAIRSFNEAIKLFEELHNYETVAGTIANLGSVYFAQNNFKEAKIHYQKSLDLFTKLGNIKGIILGHLNLGNANVNDGNPELAITHYKNSLEINKGSVIKKYYLSAITGLGEANWKLKKYELAEMYYTEAAALAKENKIRPSLMDIYKGLLNIHAEKGDFKKAFDFQKLYQNLKDSMYNEENSKQIAALHTSHEIALKQSEINLMAKEKALQALALSRQKLVTYLSIIAVILLVVLSAITLNRYNLKKKSNELLAAQNEEIKTQQEQIELFNKQLRLQALRAQMDPHFIFNSLNAIQHFITINDSDSSLKYLSKFSKLIRQILENAHNRQLSLHDEITFLEYYMQLEKLRFNDKFDFKISVDPSIDIYNTEIPTLLLQPYLENAILHGLVNKDEKGEVKLSIGINIDSLLCVIEDNGIGRQKSAEVKNQKSTLHKSRGMIVNKERLEIINEGMNDKISIHIIDLLSTEGTPTGTRVEIQIPVELD